MKIVPTRRTDYAIRALIHLAHRDGEICTAAEIAGAMDVPQPFLQQVMPILQRAGLVLARPGRNGGYTLARRADEVTLLDVVEATEGPLEATECALRGGPCHWEEVCALHWVWSASREAFAAQLRRATLARVAADDRAIAEGAIAPPDDSHRRRR